MANSSTKKMQDSSGEISQGERSALDTTCKKLKQQEYEEQKRRFEARTLDPLQQWKLSSIDLPSRERWYDYSRARDAMLERTDTDYAPWYTVDINDKRRSRLNVISHLLSQFPYKRVATAKFTLPDRDETNKYDDVATLSKRRWIPENY